MDLSPRALIRASSLLVLSLLAPAACSSSDNDGGSSAPVAETLSNPKSANVPFGGGKMNLGWTTIVADGATAPLASAVLQLPGETSEHIASSGTIYLGPTELRAKLTFATGKIGACLSRTK